MNMPYDAHSDVSDDALLVLFANGDPTAARLLTLRLTPRVLAYAQRMLGNRAEAEDVAQEAMLRLWRVARDWRQDQAKVSTWLFRVTSNLCTDLLRRRRSVPLDGIAEPEDGQPGALAGMIEQDRAKALDEALKLLPDRQRQAVILRHLEGFTNPEIAEMMEIGVEAVESLTARGKRCLALALAGRREELGYDAE
jgi:RNA polymerase sigma factor (sigma-70 family)